MRNAVCIAAYLLLSSFSAHAAEGEVRLEARLFSLSQTTTEESYESDEAGSREETTAEDWDATSAYPLLGVMAYDGTLALGATLGGSPNSFTLATLIGAKASKAMEVGGQVSLGYSTTKKEEKQTANDVTTKEKSHDSARNLAVGPYVRFSFPTGGGKVEIMTALHYLRRQEDSGGTFGHDSEKKTGYGLKVEPALVVNLNKNLQYFGAFGFGIENFESGERVDESAGARVTSELNTDQSRTLSATPLGLRLVL